MVLKRGQYPLRGQEYANRLYTDYQHVILLALRQHFRKSYREFCDIIKFCTPLLDDFGLKDVWATGLPVKTIVVDRWYDTDSGHEYAQEDLGTKTAIPVPAASLQKVMMRGQRPNGQAKEFD